MELERAQDCIPHEGRPICGALDQARLPHPDDFKPNIDINLFPLPKLYPAALLPVIGKSGHFEKLGKHQYFLSIHSDLGQMAFWFNGRVKFDKKNDGPQRVWDLNGDEHIEYTRKGKIDDVFATETVSLRKGQEGDFHLNLTFSGGESLKLTIIGEIDYSEHR